MSDAPSRRHPLCPSARLESPGAKIFGVVDRSSSRPRVRYLAEATEPTPELLANLHGAPPGEVLRLTAPCAGDGCAHHRAGECTLGERLVELGTPRTARVPACLLRAAGCRWFLERGIAACLQCEWVVSDAATFECSEALRVALGGPPLDAARANVEPSPVPLQIVP